MINHETAAETRIFFGGLGRLSKAEVRERVWLALAFTLREVMRGIHVAMGKQCRLGCGAYVYGNTISMSDVIRPNTNPGAPELGEYAKGPDGRYHIYICNSLFPYDHEFFNTYAAALFLHEMVHHAGAIDITYDRYEAQRLPQDRQLQNANNYMHFFMALTREEREESQSPKSEQFSKRLARTRFRRRLEEWWQKRKDKWAERRCRRRPKKCRSQGKNKGRRQGKKKGMRQSKKQAGSQDKGRGARRTKRRGPKGKS
mmetsp:Transcript_49127/g.143027  ORF Transcript_49127/g.143027 Transcript_49127/m.143027 type:complete len:257 (-) Transcript_49127:52-822(-)